MTVREPLVRYGTPPQATNGATPAPDERPVHDYACRSDGCENRANAKWSRGALSGLCWEVHVPKQRKILAENGRKRHLGQAVRTIESPWGWPEPDLSIEDAALRAAEPEPELDVEPASDPEREPGEEPPAEGPEPGPEPTLAELAAELERAERAVAVAEELYEHAVERFRAHPLVRRLDVYPQES